MAGLGAGIAFILIFAVVFGVADASPRAVPTQPEITQQQAIDTAIQDLTTKFIKNPVDIKIYTIVGHQEAQYLSIQNFTKGNWTLQPLFYVHSNGSFYLINATTHATTRCHLPYCPLPVHAMKVIEGRLAWIVDLASACDNFPNNTTNLTYAVDARNGSIIWRGGNLEPKQAAVCR